jgi:hypothetical protein
MFYKRGDKWIVTKDRKEIASKDNKQQAALIHYEQVEPHLLEDYKAGKLTHTP